MINELTTVAAVWPLAPFMSSYSSVGSGTSDATNLAAAFALAANYANISTGTIPGLNVPAGATVPVTQINTLADILSTCVDSTGGVAGDGSACGTLFSAATPTGGTAPVNVISAGLAIANNPTANIPALFGLVSAATPYQPTLSTAPADLAVGLSTTAAGLSVSPIALAFPAAYLGISSAPQSVWITNTSALPITLDGDNFLGANPGDFRVGNYHCPATLGVGGSCTEQIIFMPSVAGERTASWTISDSGPVNPSLGVPSQSGPTVTLTGIGIAGTGGPLTLSPSSLTFTEVGIPQTVIVTNNGTVPVMLGAITSSIGGLMSTTCGTTLDAQSICTISVQIPNLGAAYSAMISVPNSSVTGTLSLPITVPESNAYIFNSSPLQFGDWALGLTSPFYPELLYPYPPPELVPYPPAPTFNLSITGPNAADFAFQAPMGDEGCGMELYCGANITFTPTALGPRTATLVTNYGNIPLSGNGIPAGPSFTLSAQSLNAQLNLSSNSSQTVFDNGTTNLNLSATVTGPNASEFSANFYVSMPGQPSECTPTPTSGCSLNVAFTAAQVGAQTATLTVTDSISGISKSVSLSGTGVPLGPAPPTITPNQLSFGNIQVGSVSTQTLQ
jgi:trimeric autotransporter adhesin